ncbi:pyridoxal phosphate-dependent aminotransferase [Synechococcus sp. PROS-U-1]|uniref:pyridoxal phosphate-dependent aminotransferase n=1 Tax=Synechococcus sp. PROS-U-1 TaxID=1400866 RepID=UPI0016485B91|nr:aminotransferase class I/II-fold pyridoxal phosphate-dependent enzyme [Synechococcus sp. PROS-U-1]QNJ01751.1 aspartate aminotransferase [Synechococcus sp. PROS-U-1]
MENRPPLSDACRHLEGQQMFQILSKCKDIELSGEKILHFEIGDPDYDTPDEIVNAAISSLRSGRTHYESSSGNYNLINRAREVTLKSRGFQPDPDQLLVTPGANYQIFLSLACICNPGDEVLIPDPGFVSYKSVCQFLNLKPVYYPLRQVNNFEINHTDIEPLVTTKTKAIILNSPSNPTGSVSSEDQVVYLYNLCKDFNIWLVSDEIYARLIFSNSKAHFSASTIDQCKERVILINGFSKAFAMTGWRIGVVTAPTFVIEKMRLLLETSLSCVPPFIQDAACEALSVQSHVWKLMLTSYEQRRDLLWSGLSNLNSFKVYKPQGAFYIFPDITATGYSDIDLANILLDECRIAVTPGSFFGPSGKNHIRFSFCCPTEDIKVALELLYAKFG